MDENDEGFGPAFYVMFVLGIIGVIGFFFVAGGAMAGG